MAFKKKIKSSNKEDKILISNEYLDKIKSFFFKEEGFYRIWNDDIKKNIAFQLNKQIKKNEKYKNKFSISKNDILFLYGFKNYGILGNKKFNFEEGIYIIQWTIFDINTFEILKILSGKKNLLSNKNGTGYYNEKKIKDFVLSQY